MRVIVWLPAVIIIVGLWILSSTPNLAVTTGTAELILRKGAHITAYAALTASLLLGLRASHVSWARALPLAASGAILYGVIDEIHQSTVPTRHGTPVDVAIDAVGAGLAVAGGIVLARRSGRP